MARAGKRRNSRPPAKGGPRKRSRTDFRAEFYRDGSDDERRRLAAQRALDRARKRRGRVPLAVTLGCFGILLCIIAVGGSSAMIWLRKLGAVFGVYWEGDF